MSSLLVIEAPASRSPYKENNLSSYKRATPIMMKFREPKATPHKCVNFRLFTVVSELSFIRKN